MIFDNTQKLANRKNIVINLLALTVVSLLTFLVWKCTGIYFETNDDRLLTEIMSGATTLKPDAHAVYVNYLLALPISKLYTLTNAVPWYGLCLILFQVLAYTLVLITIYHKCRNKLELLLGTFFFVILFSSNIYLLGRIQYTSTAILMAIAGYLCLIIEGNSKRSNLFFFVLELLSFMLRKESMLMIVPLGVAVWAVHLLMQTELTVREKIRHTLHLLWALFGIIFICYIGNAFGYRAPEWQEYLKWNRARTEVFDYVGTPSYEEIKSILDSHKVTEASYRAYCDSVMLDMNMDADCMQAIADYFAEQPSELPPMTELRESLYLIWLQNLQLGTIPMTVAAGILLLIWIVLSGQKKLILPVIALFLSEVFVWGYLIIKGRMPLRVTLPLFVCATFLLLALMYRSFRTDMYPRWKKIVILSLCLIYCCVGLSATGKQYRQLKSDNKANYLLTKGLNEIQDYCRTQQDKKFLIDFNITLYCSGSALETEYYRDRNNVATGNWYSHSPAMLAYWREYLTDSLPKLHLIVSADFYEHSLVSITYLEEMAKSKLVPVDSFTTSSGGNYSVYAFQPIQ